MNNAKKTALYGVLISLAMLLSYLESLIPVFFAIPGIKIGLTNIVVVFCLYCINEKSAILINILRIILVGFIFSNGISIVYSLTGGLLSILIMITLYKLTKLHMVTVSILGGVFHNIGQIIIAGIILKSASIMWYLPFLWLSGIVAGIIVGLISSELCKYMMPFMKSININ